MENAKEVLDELKDKYDITIKGEKPTPSGVGWIAHT
jgi:hypothetical protein